MRRFLILLVGFGCMILTGSPALRADDSKDPATDPLAKAQRAKAEALWQNLVPTGKPLNYVDSPNFCLVGTGDLKSLTALGKAAERALQQIGKTLKYTPADDGWDGKLYVHVCDTREQFRSIHDQVFRRRPNREETAAYRHEGNLTFIILGPPESGKRKVPLEHDLVQQLAIASLTRKCLSVPAWFALGYGRAACIRHDPRGFLQERRQAALLLAQGKKIEDACADDGSMEQVVLAGSLLDFLAHAPVMAKFWPAILEKLTTDQSFLEVLKDAKCPPEQVWAAWRTWAQRPS